MFLSAATRFPNRHKPAQLDIVDEIKADPTASNTGELSYYISFSYIDRNNHSSVVRVSGSRGFPANWAQFADIMNEICGRDIFVEDPVLLDDPACDIQELLITQNDWHFN